MAEREPAPAAVGGPADLIDRGAMHEFGAVMARVRGPLPITPAEPNEYLKPTPERFARPAQTIGVTSYTRPFDKEMADYFTGNHAIIEHVGGLVRGQQNPQGGPVAVVYRPRALPWDCGTAVGVSPPSAAPGTVYDPTVNNHYAVDRMPR